MKKVIILLCVFCFGTTACTSAQQNQQLTKAKLIGTWKSKNVDTDEVFYFAVYPDNRTLAYSASGERWEKYDIEDGEYCAFNETDEETYCSTITYFDGKKLRYTTSTGGHFIAEKISDKPTKVAISATDTKQTQHTVKQNQALTQAKLIGTWKAKNLNTDESYYFCVYPNNRTQGYGKGWENWEKYTIGDKSYCAYDDKTGEEQHCMYFTYFDGKEMEFNIPTNGFHYYAEKVSDKQIKITTPIAEPNEKKIILRSVDCPYCHNTCKMNCMICSGAGGTYEQEYNYNTKNYDQKWKMCYHCSGGKTACLHCDCGMRH